MNAITPRSTWGARYRDGVGTRSVGRLEKYLHHTVTAHLSKNATPAQERAQMRILERIGQQRFGGGISYPFEIFPSGRIYQGASINRITYHSGSGRNTRGVGIALVGNFEANTLNMEVFRAVVWLLQEGVRKGWWGDPALTEYHKQFRATSCPGKYAISRFSDMNKAGRGGKVSAPESSTSTGSAKTYTKRKSIEANVPVMEGKGVNDKQVGTAHAKGYTFNVVKDDGSWTQVRWKYPDQTYRNAWVAKEKLETPKVWPHVNVPVTDRHTTESHNAWVKLLADVGYKDTSLTTAMQKWLKDLGYYKRYVDDDFGPYMVEALQRFLKDKGFYKGIIDAHTAPYSQARGPMLIRAEIGYLNDQRRYY